MVWENGMKLKDQLEQKNDTTNPRGALAERISVNDMGPCSNAWLFPLRKHTLAGKSVVLA